MVNMNTAPVYSGQIPGRRRSKLAAATLGVWLIIMCVPSEWVLAQGDTFQSVRDYMDRTLEIIMRAEETVRNSQSTRARNVFHEARKLHEYSERLWTQGRPRMAFKASEGARQAARHAARLARDELSFEERTRIRLERLRDLHDQVIERAQEVNDQRVLRFVREAERHFHRARELYLQRDFEMAFTLLESAEKMLRRAARLIFEGGGAGRLENELDRTREFLVKTRERLGPDADPEAIELLHRAESLLGQAREAVAAGDPFHALHSLRQARRLAGQAVSLAGGGPTAESVRAQIERWDARYSRVSEDVYAADSEEARLVLERAQRYRQRAEELLGDDDRIGALRQIKIAHDLLNEASELIR
jgi:hypothetical protein